MFAVPAAIGLLCVSVLVAGVGIAWAAPGRAVPAAAAVKLTPAAAQPARTGAARRASVPFRPLDPARYAQQKAAADNAYRHYAASHRQPVPVSSALGGPLVASVSLNQPGLTAADGGGSTPPDPTGAIGPNFYVEFVNSAIAVYSRTTLASPPVSTASENAFTRGTSTCDGQIKWDQAAQRFEYYSLDCGASTGQQGFSLGWSKTSNPTDLTAGGWCKYHFSTFNFLEDYGKLGNSNTFLIVGTNEFDDSDPAFPYTGSPIFVISKPANGSTACPFSPSGSKFAPPTADEQTPEPVNVFGSTVNGYVAATSGSVTNALRMYTISGTTTPVLTDNGNITVPTFAVPANVPQPAPAPASDVIDSSDARLTQANAAIDPALGTFGIWTQHTVAGAGGGPSVVRWYELQAGRTTPVQTGTVSAGTNFAFNAAISPTIAGNTAAVEYNVGGASQLVQLHAQSRGVGDAAGTMTGDVLLGASTAVDVDFSCPSVTSGSRPCRWGDYAGASPDPNSANAVWGTNQLNGASDGFSGAQWLTQNFALQIALPPTISSFTPAGGVAGSTVVTITGTNLTGASAVKFNGIAATIGSDTATQITATAPNGVTAGKIAVTTGAGTATSTATFTPTFSLANFGPLSGPMGTQVTINGVGFNASSTVAFNGVAGTGVVLVSPIQLKATVPSTATTGPITVTNTTAPVGTVRSVASYTVTPFSPPTISSITPTSGITGSSVTIAGTFLSGANPVKFGTLPAIYTIVSATQITVIVPNSTVPAPISVTTAAGSTTSTQTFTPTLAVTSFTPASATTGAVVTIDGVGFNAGSTVKFNGVPAAGVLFASATQLLATVPSTATSGPIAVTNATAPVGTVQSAASFTKT